MMNANKSLLLLGMLSACTFSTGANDREIVDKLDFELTMTEMKPHATQQIDVALVRPVDPAAPIVGDVPLGTLSTRYNVAGRVRVLLPPDPELAVPRIAGADLRYPDVTVRLHRAVEADETMLVLFYADNNLNNQADVFVENTTDRFEHSWIKPVPVNGQLGFYHEFKFQNFADGESRGPSSSDIVLEIPPLTDARAACLDQALAQTMKTSLEVRIISNPSQTFTQVAGFQMYAGNTVPRASIVFKGLSDLGSQYGVESFVDGQRAPDAVLSPTAGATGVTIPFDAWFPINVEKINACLAMP